MSDRAREINQAYFEWMYDLVCGRQYSERISHRKLLTRLHDTEFIFLIPKDENRAMDGVSLRHRFALSFNDAHIEDYINGPCSVLEMMIALALRCEENIMDDPHSGNRTGQWFWSMIVSLDLGSMTDCRYDEKHVDYCIDRFLYREYEPDGRGGLFTIENCDRDLRKVEIWNQLCWYLNDLM